MAKRKRITRREKLCILVSTSLLIAMGGYVYKTRSTIQECFKAFAMCYDALKPYMPEANPPEKSY